MARPEQRPRTEITKVTFYLPSQMVEELEQVWLELRAQVRRLKKTDIVRLALTEYLSEYQDKGAASHLAQALGLSAPKVEEPTQPSAIESHQHDSMEL